MEQFLDTESSELWRQHSPHLTEEEQTSGCQHPAVYVQASDHETSLGIGQCSWCEYYSGTSLNVKSSFALYMFIKVTVNIKKKELPK